jgi:hypothetical protein
MPAWFAALGIINQLLPVLINAVTVVAKDKGKPVEEVVSDVINHLTPGQPNSPALNG